MGTRIGGLIAAAVVVLGAFLPWASVSVLGYSETVGGMDGDGVITLIGGLSAGVLIGLWKRGTVIAAAVVSVLVFLTGLYDLVDIQRTAGDLGAMVDASAGIGLYLTVLAALVMAVLAFIGQAGIKQTPTAFAGAPYGIGQAPAWGQAPAEYGQPYQQQPAQQQPYQQQPVQQQPQAAATPAGWHPDPYGQAQLRYWDGTRWTEHTHNQ